MLDHENVVKMHAIVFEPHHYGVVLEYVPHGNLRGYLDRHRVRYIVCQRILI